MPSAGDSSVPSSSVIFWVALWVAKQYQGSPRLQARHSPQTARQFRTTKSPGRHRGDAVADGLDDARGLVAEQERELVVDAALAVVQVGVADPAGLDLHHRLPRTGIGHVDRDDLDGLALGAGDDGLDLLHGFLTATVGGRAGSRGAVHPSAGRADPRRGRVRRGLQPACAISRLGGERRRKDGDDGAAREHRGAGEWRRDGTSGETPSSRRTCPARQPTLLRTAYLLTGDQHTAEDLVQTALAKLYLSWDRVQDRELDRRLRPPDPGQREQLAVAARVEEARGQHRRRCPSARRSATGTTRARAPALWDARADAAAQAARRGRAPLLRGAQRGRDRRACSASPSAP